MLGHRPSCVNVCGRDSAGELISGAGTYERGDGMIREPPGTRGPSVSCAHKRDGPRILRPAANVGLGAVPLDRLDRRKLMLGVPQASR